MRVTGALLLTLSAVTPASSVFVVIPGILQQAGSGAFISLGGAALIALCMAFVYAELASAFPHAGGEYAMLGRTLGRFVGFVFMTMNTVGSTLAPAVLALGASDYLAAVIPGTRPVPTAVAIVVAATLLGILNIRLNAWVTGLFLVVELATLLVLVALGFSAPQRPVLGFLLHPVIAVAGGLAPAPPAMIGLAAAVAVFAYNGFGSAVYFSEEMHEAPRRIARTILWALGLTVAFEFIPVVAVLVGAPDLHALLASAAPFGDFVGRRGGRTLQVVVSAGIALAIINAVIATVLINARFFFSSGRDGVWHGALNGVLTRVHSRFDSPWGATLLAGATATASCFIPFHLLLVMNGTGVVVMYILLCVAVIAGRITGATGHGPYRMPLFPIAPGLALAALCYVVWANWIDPQVGRPSLLVSVALAAVGAVYFLILSRGRGDWALRGPPPLI